MAIDLVKITEQTQREANDASDDYHYVKTPRTDVGEHFENMLSGGIGAEASDDEATNMRRIDTLKFAAVQAIKLRRSNGGHGQALVRFEIDHERNGFLARFAICTSPGDAFDLIRQGFCFPTPHTLSQGEA